MGVKPTALPVLRVATDKTSVPMSGNVLQLPGVEAADASAPAFGEDGWTLPPGAVPMDCVAFGKVVRGVERLTRRLAEAERELSETRRKLDRLTAEVNAR